MCYDSWVRLGGWIVVYGIVWPAAFGASSGIWSGMVPSQLPFLHLRSHLLIVASFGHIVSGRYQGWDQDYTVLDPRLVWKVTLYKVFMSDWPTCKDIPCKTHSALQVNTEKKHQFSFVLCLRYHLTHQIRRKRKFDISDCLQWGHNSCHMDLAWGLLLLLYVFWHRPIGRGMVTDLLVGKHISGVITGRGTGLILQHSYWVPLHPAFTRWYEMNPFGSSGSFINKSKKIILPTILGKVGIRSRKVRITRPFIFLFISVWNNIAFKAGIQSSLRPM